LYYTLYDPKNYKKSDVIPMPKPKTKIEIYQSFENHLIAVLSNYKLDPIEYINVLQVLIHLNQEIRKLKNAEKYTST
jgi:hypothetical protein